MNFGPAACRPHELAKLSRLHGGFSPPALPKPAGVRSVRYRTAWGCGVRDPRGQKPAAPRPGKGVQKFWNFLNDGNEVTNYYMFHALFDFSKKF